MKKTDVRMIVLVIYLQVVLVIYFWLLIPIITKSKDLAPTKVPSLSISGLKEAGILFNGKGKEWTEYPQEPDISTFTFGQTDPIQIITK